MLQMFRLHKACGGKFFLEYVHLFGKSTNFAIS